MVIALGVTEGGEKRPLGFVQTETENQTTSRLHQGVDRFNAVLTPFEAARSAPERASNRGGSSQSKKVA